MWIIPPSIQSDFALASECSKKEFTPDLNSWASETAQSCTLSGKLSPQATWQRAWKKESWLQRLSGLAILPNYQQNDFAAWWISSLQDSPAKTSPSPAAVLASTANDPVFSSTCLMSQMIAVRGASFWRTSQASLLPPPPLWTKRRGISKSEPLPESWENWPTAGGMRNGSIYRRPMWAPAMEGRGGSASRGAWERWDTPDSMPDMPNTGSNRKSQPAGLGNQARMANQWMTPHGMSGMDANGKLGAGGEFSKQVTHWTTPTALERSGQGEQNRALVLDVKNWPTPNAHDGRRPGADLNSTQGMNLSRDAALWPTPAARDHKGSCAEGGLTRMDGKSRMDQLANAAVFSPLGQALKDGQPSSPSTPGSPQPSETKKLNPYFVEWLMGWPAGWTSPIVRPASVQEEMASYRSALQAQLSSLFGAPESSGEIE